jgi:hypothetical protein
MLGERQGVMQLRLAFLGCLVGFFVLGGCAPMAAQHQADAAFRKALAAQLASQDDYAEQQYKEVIALGFNWSPVWNNLAVIAVHRHEYRVSRHLLAQAVASNDRDLVALTNYGVMSYYLSDFREARRTLVDAQRLRREILNHIPSMGHDDYQHDHYEKVTESLVHTAARYLDRIDKAELGVEPPVPSDVVAAITPARF